MRNSEDTFEVTRAMLRILAREKKKEKRRKARLTRGRRKIRKIAKRVNDPDLYGL